MSVPYCVFRVFVCLIVYSKVCVSCVCLPCCVFQGVCFMCLFALFCIPRCVFHVFVCLVVYSKVCVSWSICSNFSIVIFLPREQIHKHNMDIYTLQYKLQSDRDLDENFKKKRRNIEFKITIEKQSDKRLVK